jgi:TRAP-type C4-dicarboxylate transport system permease small subunit
MAWYGTGLVAIDYAEGLQSSGGSVVAALRACFAESILPLAFGLMALRFALRAFAPPAHAPLLLRDPDGVAQ